MKKIFLLITLTTLLACCNKDDKSTPTPTPDSQLPPATQTGANTFGCLLDGVIFKPGLTNNSYQCYYQLVNGEYYFNVNANYEKNGILKSLAIFTAKLAISEGQNYILKENNNGNVIGKYFVGNNNSGIIEEYYTSTINTGELKITKLDFTNNIVSGTFWYDVKDNQNVTHQIRDGRFDMRFTQ